MNSHFSLTRTRSRAFSLMEVLVSVSVVSIVFVSMYSGLSMCVGFVQLARENLRAAQILQEKMETIRLYNWDQLNQAGFVPATFKAPFYTPNSGSNPPSDGNFNYDGTLKISSGPFVTETYKDDIKMVEVTVSWTTGKIPRTRSVSTFVARDGLQNYIY